MKKRVMVVFGTRPEAIKMAPVIRELQSREDLEPIVVVTSQHREMLHQVLATFGITPHFDLDIMKPGQDLEYITTAVIEKLSPIVREVRPDVMLVHGDTTTAMAASFVGYYNGVKVGHVEAGLRSFDKHAPFPEEVNRKVVGILADFHFAPTQVAVQNLLGENIAAQDIFLTGNTIVDAITQISRDSEINHSAHASLDAAGMKHWDKRIILVTGHRRENLDGGINGLCEALVRITDTLDNVVVVFPVHLNPQVKDTVHAMLGGRDRIVLLEPQGYESFVYLMSKAALIITDSGGIQEEAAALKKPVLITRDVTERPEIVEAGNGTLVGSSPLTIYHHAIGILASPKPAAFTLNPFGDGFAAKKICDIIEMTLCKD